MTIFLNLTVTAAFFAGMEAVAWLTHKYVMHGILWKLHEDHHHKEHKGFFERNDFFFLLFATPGILLLFSGWEKSGFNPLFYAGLGITLYGFAYFFVHDIFIHQRFQILKKTDNLYFKAIRRAHKVHHKHLGKKDGECFGMLWVPLKYFREARRNQSS